MTDDDVSGICGQRSEHGDVCVEPAEREHWLHSSAADADGYITAWGEGPENWTGVECPNRCGLVVGVDDEPVTIVHNEDGSHTFVQAGTVSTVVDVRVLDRSGKGELRVVQGGAENELVEHQLDPHYHVTALVDGVVVGLPERPIPDPFARTTVEIGWRDILKIALRRRKRVKVVVAVGGDWDAIQHVMKVRPIMVVPNATGASLASIAEAMNGAGGFCAQCGHEQACACD